MMEMSPSHSVKILTHPVRIGSAVSLKIHVFIQFSDFFVNVFPCLSFMVITKG